MSDDPKILRELFESMGPVPIPAEVQMDSFLDGIYHRAAEAEAESLAPVIDEGLTAVSAPEGTCWTDREWRELEVPAAAAAEVSRRLDQAFPSAPTPVPGLLWSRIREDLRDYARDTRRSNPNPMRRTALWSAAALLLIGLTAFFFNSPSFQGEGGTNTRPNFVFKPVDTPINDRLIGG